MILVFSKKLLALKLCLGSVLMPNLFDMIIYMTGYSFEFDAQASHFIGISLVLLLGLLKTLLYVIKVRFKWRFFVEFHVLLCHFIKGLVKLISYFWFQLMVREMEIHFLFSKATLQNNPFGVQTSFFDDIIIEILFIIE